MWVFAKDLTYFLTVRISSAVFGGSHLPTFSPYPPELILLRDCAVRGGNRGVDKAGVNELLMMKNNNQAN